MEAQISAATWALLLVPLIGVVVLSALGLFKRSEPETQPAPREDVGGAR